jgi:hypothetical protein
MCGVVVVVAVACASCGGGAAPFVVTNARADVSITHCGVMSDGDGVAGFTVTNHSSVESDYVTTISFSTGGSRVPSGPGFERGVAAGRSVKDQVVSTQAVGVNAMVRCTVSSVRRTPSTVTTPTTD